MVEMTRPVNRALGVLTQRGIFLSNKPDSNELQWAWLKEKCRLTPILVAGSFRPFVAGLISTDDSQAQRLHREASPHRRWH
jgi:hypothetical protein